MYFSNQKYYFQVNGSGYLGLISSLDSPNVRWILWKLPSTTLDIEVIDTLGDFQGDPGTGWSVAGVSNATKDRTLIRKPNVTKGNSNWDASRGTNIIDSEWYVRSVDTISNIKSHQIDGVGYKP